jgi:DegV family protein with EDD domain
MERRIIADSSSNVTSLQDVSFASASLKMLVGGKEYTDDVALDVPAFRAALAATKGKTSTSSPNIGDWLDAFGDADEVFVVALTSGISSGYNSALTAASLYQSRRFDARVFVLDSRSAGPELELIVEEYARLIKEDLPFHDIVAQIEAYSRRTHLMFTLSSLNNFARNGRVSPLVAKMAGTLNIHIVGQASALGELELMDKVRGGKASLEQLLANMKAAGFNGKKARLRHTSNVEAAQEFAALIRNEYPGCDITVDENRGLCSYYAETGGVLVGFESAE